MRLELAARDVLTPAAEPRSLAERAYQLLVKMITRLDLPPGSLIVERELMARLGIGRTPIREALQRLSNEGLIVHLPKRGMLVADISAASVQHIYEFRSLIDSAAVRFAAQRATHRQTEELSRLAEALVAAGEVEDADAYVDLDRQFYQLLAAASESIYLAEVIARIFNLHLRLWFYISARQGGWGDLTTAHSGMACAVAEAIARRDADEAERAVKAYIDRRHQDMRELL